MRQHSRKGGCVGVRGLPEFPPRGEECAVSIVKAATPETEVARRVGGCRAGTTHGDAELVDRPVERRVQSMPTLVRTTVDCVLSCIGGAQTAQCRGLRGTRGTGSAPLPAPSTARRHFVPVFTPTI